MSGQHELLFWTSLLGALARVAIPPPMPQTGKTRFATPQTRCPTPQTCPPCPPYPRAAASPSLIEETA